nr:response regulator [uncultured Lacibacter sp.]
MKPIHILLVEDNEGDILLTTEALKERKIINHISVLKDGKQAIDYLAEQVEKNAGELPDLLLLDINLPKRNGHEVLAFIKNDERLKHLPVIILTTSSSLQDVNLSYKNHANCYITKPVEADDFLNVMNKIEDFWVTIVKLPEINK